MAEKMVALLIRTSNACVRGTALLLTILWLSASHNGTHAQERFAESAEARPSQRGAAQQPANSIDDLLLFFPSKYPQGNWQPKHLKFEDVWFNAADHVRLHAWYCPVEKPRAYLLYAHGNGGNISHRWSLLLRLQRLGIATLAFDYRGYGRSAGIPSKSGILQDAVAARTKLAELGGVSEAEIVLMGRSLGGAVVIQVAAQAPARGLIVESSFSSLASIAAHHYPRLAWLVRPDSLNSAETLPQHKGPLLISHGDADQVVPLAHGRHLFRVANEPKSFITIRGGRHNSVQPAKYDDTLLRFIDSL